MLSARVVRRAAVVVCGLGIVAMIAGSVAESTGLALTAGLVSAVAVLCLLVASAVGTDLPPVDETVAAEVERKVAGLVADGADEAQLRALVRAAVRLGRRSSPTAGGKDPSVGDESCR